MYISVNDVSELRPLKHGCCIAGGTDLIPLLKAGVKKPATLIDVTKIPELGGIRLSGADIFIGAAVTLAEIAGSSVIRQHLPALAESAARTASLQIRNVATLGGNVMQDRRCIFFNQSAFWRSSLPKCFKTGGSVCHQIKTSPQCRAIYYSDPATALFLYEAQVCVLKDGNRAVMPIADLVAAHSARNGLSSDDSELLVLRFVIPLPPGQEKSCFLKYSVRASIDFPIVNFGLRHSGGARPALAVAGAIAPVPQVLRETSAFLDSGGYDRTKCFDIALRELKAKSRLIRESVITPQIKRDSFRMIWKLLPQEI